MFRKNSTTQVRLLNRLTAYNGPAFLESLVAVFPLFGMTTTPDYTQLVIKYPFGVLGDWRPKTLNISALQGRLIGDVINNAMGPSVVLLRPRPTGGPWMLTTFDASIGRLIPALDIANPGPLDFCRRGCLWFTDGLMLKKGVINDDGGVDMDISLLLPATPQAPWQWTGWT